jgi:hypothetical protein
MLIGLLLSSIALVIKAGSLAVRFAREHVSRNACGPSAEMSFLAEETTT